MKKRRNIIAVLLLTSSLASGQFGAPVYASTAIGTDLSGTNISFIGVAAIAAQTRAEMDAADWKAYSESTYEYCDAKLIAAIHSEEVFQGKLRIGGLVKLGKHYQIRPMLEDSRERGNKCDFEDTGMSYENAEKLAEVWNIEGGAAAAKVKIADAATHGLLNNIRFVLGLYEPVG